MRRRPEGARGPLVGILRWRLKARESCIELEAEIGIDFTECGLSQSLVKDLQRTTPLTKTVDKRRWKSNSIMLQPAGDLCMVCAVVLLYLTHTRIEYRDNVSTG